MDKYKKEMPNKNDDTLERVSKRAEFAEDMDIASNKNNKANKQNNQNNQNEKCK